MPMRSVESIARYKLVPQPPPSGNGAAPPQVRRYRLARVGVARRSALGVDRHERLEQIAQLESEGRNGPTSSS
jgi:hypothetical protein